MTRTAMQAIDVAGPVCGGCQSRRPERIVPKQLAPSQCHRRPSGAQFLSRVGARPFLLPPRFHGAPGVEAACRHRGQNSRANNELAGAPEEIRTSTPRFVVWRSGPSSIPGH